MIRNKTLRAILIILILTLIGTPTTVEAKSSKLNKSNTSVRVGKTTKIKMLNNKKKVKWSTSNKQIVKITKRTDKYVKVKGVKRGSAKIIAKIGSKKFVCKVNVKKASQTVSKKKLLEAYSTVTRTGMTYCLFYMNNDSIPELLCYSSDECCVYTYKNGMACRVPNPVGWKIDGRGIYFAPKKNVLYTRTNMGIYIAQYSNFKIVKEASAGIGFDGTRHYNIEGKEVTYSIWKNTLMKWGLSENFENMEIIDVYNTLEAAYQKIVKK